VDKRVMPIDQMMVTITRPLEEAVKQRAGAPERSVDYRAGGRPNRSFLADWNVDMFQSASSDGECRGIPVQSELPATAKIRADRLTFASFPIMGYSFTADNLDPNQSSGMATYEIKPRLNRLDGVSTVVIQVGKNRNFTSFPTRRNCWWLALR